ncbi:hypothetical protein L1987_06870 [Smallanthus sonchifolius]|uniref:Uncharacterized protein n=1 Tax=Smallanthus sonchifolius TaxID=185202 RepID=A0ACB9JZC2_9ASTR|nr:hypothetical protein L1987_06870 [Smallanthus sonchifolius]
MGKTTESTEAFDNSIFDDLDSESDKIGALFDIDNVDMIDDDDEDNGDDLHDGESLELEIEKDDNGITYEDDSGFEITSLPMKDIETPEVSFKSTHDQVFDDQDPEISKPTSPSTTIPDSAPTEPVQQEETP